MAVAVMGIGVCGCFPTSSGLSYRELIARAATMAYGDAGITPEELDGAVSVEEDFVSGYSIADEYVPDQLGMVRKPIYTICGEYLQGVCSAVMQIRTGRYRALVVEGYSKASNILNKDELLHFAYDPVWDRLGVSPHYLAGIEMQHFLCSTSWSEEEVASFAALCRSNALQNPLAPYGAKVGRKEVLAARTVSSPVTELMVARPADAAIVVVLGTEEFARERSRHPVYITGTGWSSGSSIIQRRVHAASVGTTLAAKMAYAEAGITSPGLDADVYYVSDLYAHRGLMHLEALGLGKEELPSVNPDGGSLGMGDLFEANGGARLYDAVRQLRGEAGAHQVDGAQCAIVQGWRGLPTDSSAVVILESEVR
ncbi:MAG: acetyl-CoA acetyltransferase [Deltaproteobacteria bacterium]|nr:acetyl-CoA acetyltransferase [Deltaproteobacteria bacterium]